MGAVSYLQHSRYGSGTSVRINNNSDYKTGYSGVHEPTTGYTGTNISCNTTPNACNEYGTSSEITTLWNTDVGRLSSTTANITGVYDMSGGAWEYVMGVMSKDGVPCNGRDSNLNSGFNGVYCNTTGSKTDGIDFPTDSKYYDVYEYATVERKYNRRILGDATGEMGPFAAKMYETKNRQIGSWYADEAWFVHAGVPWFNRGDYYVRGVGAGVFAFAPDYGSVSSTVGYRVVLSI